MKRTQILQAIKIIEHDGIPGVLKPGQVKLQRKPLHKHLGESDAFDKVISSYVLYIPNYYKIPY